MQKHQNYLYESGTYVIFHSPRPYRDHACVPGRKRTPQSQSRNYMQPPFIFQNLRATIDQLKTEAIIEQARSVQTVPKESIPDEYVERIQRWVSRLPPVQRSRKFSIAEVITLATLPGHYRPAASLRYAGEALRRCGFKQKRDWTAAGRNKRYWLLSGETK